MIPKGLGTIWSHQEPSRHAIYQKSCPTLGPRSFPVLGGALGDITGSWKHKASLAIGKHLSNSRCPSISRINEPCIARFGKHWKGYLKKRYQVTSSGGFNSPKFPYSGCGVVGLLRSHSPNQSGLLRQALLSFDRFPSPSNRQGEYPTAGGRPPKTRELPTPP